MSEKRVISVVREKYKTWIAVEPDILLQDINRVKVTLCSASFSAVGDIDVYIKQAKKIFLKNDRISWCPEP